MASKISSMNNIHMNISIVKKSNFGTKGSAVKTAAYQAEENLYRETTGRTVTKLSTGELAHKEILLPENAPERHYDRATLWNEIEGLNSGTYAQALIIALPREWTREQCIRYARTFLMEQFVSQGRAVDFAFHDDGRGTDNPNPHIHVLVTVRKYEKDGTFAPIQKKVRNNEYILDEFGNRQFKPEKIVKKKGKKSKEETHLIKYESRYNPDIESSRDTNIPIMVYLDEHEEEYKKLSKETYEKLAKDTYQGRTIIQKFRDRGKKGIEFFYEDSMIEISFTNKRLHKPLRKAWADFCNMRLSEENQVTEKSYKELGIDKIATKHMGAAAHMEEMGIATKVGDYNREAIQRNAEIEALKEALTDKEEKESLIRKVVENEFRGRQGTNRTAENNRGSESRNDQSSQRNDMDYSGSARADSTVKDEKSSDNRETGTEGKTFNEQFRNKGIAEKLSGVEDQYDGKIGEAGKEKRQQFTESRTTSRDRLSSISDSRIGTNQSNLLGRERRTFGYYRDKFVELGESFGEKIEELGRRISKQIDRFASSIQSTFTRSVLEENGRKEEQRSSATSIKEPVIEKTVEPIITPSEPISTPVEEVKIDSFVIEDANNILVTFDNLDEHLGDKEIILSFYNKEYSELTSLVNMIRDNINQENIKGISEETLDSIIALADHEYTVPSIKVKVKNVAKAAAKLKAKLYKKDYKEESEGGITVNRRKTKKE